MISKKLFLILLAFSNTTLFAGGSSSDVYVKHLQESWLTFVSLIQSFMWFFAIFPMIMAIYAVSRARQAVEKEANQGMMGMQQSATKLDKAMKEVTYLVVTILCLYVIYGTFGLVFAGASFSYTWEKLVVEFWKKAMNIL